ncbi:Osmosensitive K+ channel Signal Transduction Histidine Kinase, sensor domain protein (plasmid) [Trichormus variabilis ATCC 29413]|uniref:Osmosensitive K+ channel Signal Transduction Histidine Kinase, sensor domain protein n=2 Tax=Anabaena variabilis TaxID=264691 RepID=Q3M277_TRIV2|nr:MULTISPECIES: sensor histidine kinase [Nostocaceae]ABA24909.1 Osmosensitive K+ channel Signal Transduction Histidine Kinase, sensor domain protein [Trichormus variabilis ATCC 29413]MBC1217938.1 sensor histidine kinase KdpD [Trichormus variabilis ARAD]MBC1259342.1 sensor histidine kinase KdpD [Trichormus variabilis V5]MBC1270827.1 sensor histidine kinase KdpD [Trichormus variabilis FSR]MBC1305629.1 sensor histidine kinase KdpD [Trichormus variabilis N2B]
MSNPLPISANSTYTHPSRYGKHKILLGMAPGVGKTYRMLDEANRLKQQGKDVVIGYLETHGRIDIAAKAIGLEIIPRKIVQQGELILTQMDTDAILARQPQLVLIDELAHTNIPESGRDRRYQDVEAIVKAGIDVYSTVNIQHLEKFSNLVTQMTGIVEQECIPDYLLEVANEVVVVDVTPETLEERLLDGKIYPLDKIERSLQQLFQHRNLVLLRELVLRELADKIEQKAIKEAGYTSLAQACCVHERILVCVSTQPHSLQLIDKGAKMADCMKAPLYVLFVSDPQHFLTKEEELHIQSCKNLCQKFNGEFVQESSHNVAEKIAQVADFYRITQIVLGQSCHSRWQKIFRGSLISQLMHILAHRLPNAAIHNSNSKQAICDRTSFSQIDFHLISI